MRRVGLPDGVTVAQQTLNLFVMVQIHVGQPNVLFFSHLAFNGFQMSLLTGRPERFSKI